MSIVQRRPLKMLVAILVIALVAVTWSLTASKKAAAQGKKVWIETYAVTPVNGWADVRTVAGASNPMCAGNVPQAGPVIPASVIAWPLRFTALDTTLRLRVLDQHGAAITATSSINVTCSMLIPADATPAG
jgi:hypothetical protein